jgi:hypothetical protein
MRPATLAAYIAMFCGLGLLTGCNSSREGALSSPEAQASSARGGPSTAGNQPLASGSEPARPRSAAGSAAGHERMLAILREIKERVPDEHLYYGRREHEELRRKAENLAPDASIVERITALTLAGEAELEYEPRPDQAIKHLTEANALLAELPAYDLTLSCRVKLMLGHAYLRLGETENCCLRSNSESCIVPIRGGGVHAQTDGSRMAIKYYREFLDLPGAADDRTLMQQRYMSIWLLNVAYMTLDEYPDQVPEEYRIPPDFFQTKIPFPKFENVMPKLGLNTNNHAGGVVVDDFDNDDYLDILTCSAGPMMQTRFFRNNGDGTFTERTEEAGLTGIYGGLNLVQADYDNDGNLDVYIMRGGWLGSRGQHPDSLLRNLGNARFVDVTFDAGLGEVNFPNKTAAWADYDNDGDLDLFIGNEKQLADDIVTGAGLMFPRCQLFRNNNDGTFTDVAAEAGVRVENFAMTSVWGDFDQDRYPDLFVSGMGRFLFRNNRDGTFSNVNAGKALRRPLSEFPSWFWDFDNDGALDLFVTASALSVDRLAIRALGEEVPSNREGFIRMIPKGGNPAGPFIEYEIPALYKGDGHGGFVDVAREMGLTFPTQTMGANFGDLNGDGYLDFYLTTGNVPYWDLWPNIMYINQEGKQFVNVTWAGGFGHLQKGHGVSFADIDNDGDQDVYAQTGGQLPGDKFNDALYENPGFGHHWITIKLVGERSNKSAIGAAIHVTIIEDGKSRSIYRHVNSGGSFGCNPLRQNIGLGNAERIESIDIYWPTTDTRQVFRDVPMDQSIVITEGQNAWLPIENLRSFKLGGQ